MKNKREKAKSVLEDEMSDYTLNHIKKINYLEDWIIDAMIKYKEKEVEKISLNGKQRRFYTPTKRIQRHLI